jgi:formate dehydrogenase subunit gamma
MATRYDESIAGEIISRFDARPELLVQILHAFNARYSCIGEKAIRQIADALNLSRADVHGVVSYYEDFHSTPRGKRVLRICQAESCQAMGSRALTAHAEQALGIRMGETTSDGATTLEAVYCLGNCACSPAVLIDDKVHGRVSSEKLDDLLNDSGTAR